MQLYNLDFSADELRRAAAADRLLSMEMEFSRECNFRCAYCYLEDRTARADELSLAEIRDVVLQARELGARKIIILGGEPSIYPHLSEMLRFIASHGLEIEMFTNGTGITGELASILAAEKVRVVLKMNSRSEGVQDRLAGKKGAFAIIRQGLANLKNYREMIKGPCRTCEKSSECYGCRGAAYQLTGDYLASDPTCWRNTTGHATCTGPDEKSGRPV